MICENRLHNHLERQLISARFKRRLSDNVRTCESNLNVHLSTRCHFVQSDLRQSHVRHLADVNSKRLQTQR